ncbi:hypothetical protein RRG08_016282 [Elysia crispata]|uniref:Uncharacterized protein n=1 Tax=Elysia crispata TaxID=231223 RepID=A0AAE1EB48_9GAST|nr:hypothetical protein RRG08_016282 [Elysia crispata]
MHEVKVKSRRKNLKVKDSYERRFEVVSQVRSESLLKGSQKGKPEMFKGFTAGGRFSAAARGSSAQYSKFPPKSLHHHLWLSCMRLCHPKAEGKPRRWLINLLPSEARPANQVTKSTGSLEPEERRDVFLFR